MFSFFLSFFQVFSGLTKLRKLCNHPDLVTNDYSQQQSHDDEGEESGNHDDGLIDSRGVKERMGVVLGGEKGTYGHYSRSGKMVVVETLLKVWQKQEHKVLLFTQSRLVSCYGYTVAMVTCISFLDVKNI